MPLECEYGPATIIHGNHIHCIYNHTHFCISIDRLSSYFDNFEKIRRNVPIVMNIGSLALRHLDDSGDDSDKLSQINEMEAEIGNENVFKTTLIMEHNIFTEILNSLAENHINTMTEGLANKVLHSVSNDELTALSYGIIQSIQPQIDQFDAIVQNIMFNKHGKVISSILKFSINFLSYLKNEFYIAIISSVLYIILSLLFNLIVEISIINTNQCLDSVIYTKLAFMACFLVSYPVIKYRYSIQQLKLSALNEAMSRDATNTQSHTLGDIKAKLQLKHWINIVLGVIFCSCVALVFDTKWILCPFTKQTQSTINLSVLLSTILLLIVNWFAANDCQCTTKINQNLDADVARLADQIIHNDNERYHNGYNSGNYYNRNAPRDHPKLKRQRAAGIRTKYRIPVSVDMEPSRAVIQEDVEDNYNNNYDPVYRGGIISGTNKSASTSYRGNFGSNRSYNSVSHTVTSLHDNLSVVVRDAVSSASTKSMSTSMSMSMTGTGLYRRSKQRQQPSRYGNNLSLRTGTTGSINSINLIPTSSPFDHNHNYSSYNSGHRSESNRLFLPRVKRTVIFNPIIVILGIGEYDFDVGDNLIGIPKDYRNIIHSMNHCHGYSYIYQTKSNKLIHETKQGQCFKSVNDEIENTCKKKWSSDEIEEFNENVRDIIDSDNNNYDALIYFISCHGDEDDVIYDSEGEEYSLEYIFNIFNNKECAHLRRKPKIYFIDACRGKMRTERINDPNTTTSDTNNNTAGENNDSKETETEDEKNNDCKSEKNDDLTVKTVSGLAILRTLGNINSKSKNKKKDKRSKKEKRQSYLEEEDCRKIFANTKGHAAVDGGTKGGYLIRSFTKIFGHTDAFKNDLNNMIVMTRIVLNNLVCESFFF